VSRLIEYNHLMPIVEPRRREPGVASPITSLLRRNAKVAAVIAIAAGALVALGGMAGSGWLFWTLGTTPDPYASAAAQDWGFLGVLGSAVGFALSPFAGFGIYRVLSLRPGSVAKPATAEPAAL
jgi:hypothetical protein